MSMDAAESVLMDLTQSVLKHPPGRIDLEERETSGTVWVLECSSSLIPAA